MHPLLANRKYFFVLLFFWIVLAVIVVEVAANITGNRWGFVLIVLLPSFILLFFMVNASWFLCRQQPLSAGRFWRVFLNHLLALLIEVTVWWGSFWLYLLFLQQLFTDFDAQRFSSKTFGLLLLLQITLYLSTVFLNYLLISLQQKVEAEKLLLSEKLLKTQSELIALRNTIHPHFLFNTLTAISALVSSDPRLAQRVIGKLADFLRYSLHFQQEKVVPLHVEIEHLRNYLQVEKLRLGERLDFELQVAPEAENFPLLVMSIFPLVENAVKHGVESQLEGGKIVFQAWIEAGRLRIRVENSLPDEEPDSIRGERLGLAVLQRRLEIFYAQRGLFFVRKEQGKFISELFLPENGG